MRIGFTYNVKPGVSAPDVDDRYAEWEDEETIAGVEAALARAGEVIRLEASDELPFRLREARPDIVFNIAEGLYGPNRESHVPAICEFWSMPYTGSDPSTREGPRRSSRITGSPPLPSRSWEGRRSSTGSRRGRPS